MTHPPCPTVNALVKQGDVFTEALLELNKQSAATARRSRAALWGVYLLAGAQIVGGALGLVKWWLS